MDKMNDIIQSVRDGHSYSYTAKMNNLSRSTVAVLCAKENIQSVKNPCLCNEHVQRYVLERVRGNPLFTNRVWDSETMSLILNEYGTTPFIGAHQQFQDEIVERIRRGDSYSNVAKNYKMDRITIANWCAARNVKSVASKRCITSEQTQKEIADSVKKGSTYGEMAQKHNLNTKTIASICKKHNISSPFFNIVKNKIVYD